MVFSSLIFIFLYLPVVLFVYYITPKTYRNVLLLLFNIVFYGWGEPVFILIMIFSTLINYIFGLLIEMNRKNNNMAKVILVISILVNIGLLGFFKYTNFLVELLKNIPIFSTISPPIIPLPIGISFYTFQIMSYVIDVYRGDIKAQHDIVSFGTFVSLFPQLIAGPIVLYKDIEEQLNSRKESISKFTEGINLFIIGLAKKVLLANQLGMLWDSLRETANSNGILGAWVGIFAYTLQIYFDFSGYSDMACGLGKMLGFEFLENFNYPYISTSITEFWRRWHISLSTWFRNYLYIPLGGNRKGKLRTIFNLFVVWSLTGLWHGASMNFILWGVYYFVLLVLEKFLLSKFLNKMPKVICHGYSMFLIILGWAIFYFDNIPNLLNYLKVMFTFNQTFIGNHALNLIISYLPLLIIGTIAATPVSKNVYCRIKKLKFSYTLKPMFVLIILFISTAALVSQSYNPFLYFRF